MFKRGMRSWVQMALKAEARINSGSISAMRSWPERGMDPWGPGSWDSVILCLLQEIERGVSQLQTHMVLLSI